MPSKSGTAARGLSAACCAAYCALTGCVSVPTEPVDRLDPATATTVTVLPDPIELVTAQPTLQGTDPFAFVAPFETDQQGQRAIFVWVAAPQSSEPSDQATLLCDRHPLSLKRLTGDLAELKLSQPPYKAPTPWSSQFYFALADDGLQCLASAQAIALEIKPAAGDPQHFVASGKDLMPLQRFLSSAQPPRREAAGPTSSRN